MPDAILRRSPRQCRCRRRIIGCRPHRLLESGRRHTVAIMPPIGRRALSLPSPSPYLPPAGSAAARPIDATLSGDGLCRVRMVRRSAKLAAGTFRPAQLQKPFRFFHKCFHGFASLIPYWVYVTKREKKKAQSNDCAFPVSCVQASAHVREALHGLREVFDRLIGVAVLDPVAHAMLDVPLEHDLAAAVQG